MIKNCTIIIFLFLHSISLASNKYQSISCNSIKTDIKNFYSISNLTRAGIGLSVACLFANSSIDNSVQKYYQNSVRSHLSDQASKIVKPFGDGKITVPIFVSSIIIGKLLNHSLIEEYGSYTIRSLIIGVPPMLILQRVIGASRPNESGSTWNILKDDNGVSGHSYMGAVPFITAAKMSRNRFIKIFLYSCSTFTGISRINDNKHYFSQILLGWWLAYLSTSSIFTTDKIFVLPLTSNHINSFKILVSLKL